MCRVGFERRETRRTAASSSSTTFLRWPAVFVAGRPEALTPPVLPNRVATGATGDAIASRRMTSAFLPVLSCFQIPEPGKPGNSSRSCG